LIAAPTGEKRCPENSRAGNSQSLRALPRSEWRQARQIRRTPGNSRSPAGTPRPVVDALAAQMAKLMADPATQDRLKALSLEPLPPSTPDSFAAYIRSEVERWAVIVKNSGAELE
jgi:hypothetical protein